MGRSNRLVNKNKDRARRKKIKSLVDVEERILLFSSLTHILDGILELRNLTEEEQGESDAVRVLGKLVNKVTYLQQEGLSLIGQALPIQNDIERRSDASDGGESLSEESEDMAD